MSYQPAPIPAALAKIADDRLKSRICAQLEATIATAHANAAIDATEAFKANKGNAQQFDLTRRRLMERTGAKAIFIRSTGCIYLFRDGIPADFN